MEVVDPIVRRRNKLKPLYRILGANVKTTTTNFKHPAYSYSEELMGQPETIFVDGLSEKPQGLNIGVHIWWSDPKVQFVCAWLPSLLELPSIQWL